MSIDRAFLVEWFERNAGVGFVQDNHANTVFRDETVTLAGAWDFAELVKAIEKEQHAWGAA